MDLTSLFARELIGLDMGVSGIKVVEIKTGKIPRFVAYNRIPLPWGAISSDGEILNREKVVAALKKLFKPGHFSTKSVAVAAFGNSIIVKKITVPRMSREELQHQLFWEAEQYIPFDINDVNLDFAILGPSTGAQGKPQMEILLVAAKKQYIRDLSSVVEEAGLKPVLIDSQAFALGNAFVFSYGEKLNEGDPSHVIIDFGAGTTKVSVLEGSKTVFCRELRQAGITCTEFLSERLQISFLEAEMQKLTQPNSAQVKPILQEYAHLLVDEIAKTIDYYLGQVRDRSIQKIYICGGGSFLLGLEAELADKMPSPIERFDCTRHLAGTGEKMNKKMLEEMNLLGAVSIGLAIRKQGDTL